MVILWLKVDSRCIVQPCFASSENIFGRFHSPQSVSQGTLGRSGCECVIMPESVKGLERGEICERKLVNEFLPE
jgi:hypothetical protein